jgi:multiple sugar transport system ATP-binding protein
MASVTFEHVTKRFAADYAAVNDLSLEIHDGEFMVMVGPSGCGKTTSLRMLAGLEVADSGLIKISDRLVNQVPPRDRDIAMVFQSYALYPHMSVYDNVAFGLKMRGVPRTEIQRRVGAVAGTLGLTTLLARKPRELSGGQRQRVALGRAIVREPQVFLLDEPLSNLDAALRVETRVNLQKLHRQLKTTFIYVTHDQVEAMTLGDRIAVMKDGVLQQVSPPTELYDRPANAYVATFIGSPRMNLIPVTIDGQTAVGSGFAVRLPRPAGVRRATLGLRPEDLTDRPVDGSSGLGIELKVDATEILGAEQYLYGKSGRDDMIARVDPHFPARPGDTVPLHINPRGIQLFDAETGAAIQ